MAKFPEPPAIDKLKAITPDWHTLAAGVEVARIFPTTGRYPTTWDTFRHHGPLRSRFEHLEPGPGDIPVDQARGIMYLATGSQQLATCLVEVFQGRRRIDTVEDTPYLAIFQMACPLKLLDLTGPFATRMGASMAIHSAFKPRTQRWARRLYEAYPDATGILYCSSMNSNSPAIVLFERAAKAIPKRPLLHWPLTHPDLQPRLREAGKLFGYEVV